MEPAVSRYLADNPELLGFVRYNPEWYRYLSRDPGSLKGMEKEARRFYGKTFPQQVEKVSRQVQMASMLAKFAGVMKD